MRPRVHRTVRPNWAILIAMRGAQHLALAPAACPAVSKAEQDSSIAATAGL